MLLPPPNHREILGRLGLLPSTHPLGARNQLILAACVWREVTRQFSGNFPPYQRKTGQSTPKELADFL